jgi:hypothetical protein
MPTRSSKRMALAQLLVGGCVAAFGTCVLIKHARAQFAVPPPPPPVVNPSPPNTTVPQPSYKPISPATPSGVPGPEITSPVNEEPPRAAARTHERTSVAKTVHHRRRSTVVGSAPPYYRGRSIVAGPTPPYYYSPYAPYGCAWRRSWDGYWFRTSPCS